MEERAGDTVEQAEGLDAHKVVRISSADLRFNIEKRTTQRSKRQIGIEEVKRVLELGESGFIIQKVQPNPSFSPPIPAQSAIPKAEEPLEPVFTPANKEISSVEQVHTPRLPFELPATPSTQAFIMNIDSEGASPTVQQITRPGRGRSFLRIRTEEQSSEKEKEPERPAFAVSPQRKVEKTPVADPTPSPRDCTETFEEEPAATGYATISAPHLRMENSLSDMILPGNTKEPVKKPRKKRWKRGLAMKEMSAGPLVTLSPQAGRLIQVREYVITHLDDHYNPTFPSLYSPDVHKALSSFGSSSRRRKVLPHSNSPGDYRAFRHRQQDNWRTPDLLGSLKQGATRGESRDQLGWSGGQLRKMSMRVL